MLEIQGAGQIPNIHGFGAETRTSDILFDQLQFLVDHCSRCDSFGCPECGRYFAVREKLMKPFADVEYNGFAIAAQRRCSLNSGEPAQAVRRIGKKVHNIPSQTQ